MPRAAREQLFGLRQTSLVERSGSSARRASRPPVADRRGAAARGSASRSSPAGGPGVGSARPRRPRGCASAGRRGRAGLLPPAAGRGLRRASAGASARYAASGAGSVLGARVRWRESARDRGRPPRLRSGPGCGDVQGHHRCPGRARCRRRVLRDDQALLPRPRSRRTARAPAAARRAGRPARRRGAPACRRRSSPTASPAPPAAAPAARRRVAAAMAPRCSLTVVCLAVERRRAAASELRRRARSHRMHAPVTRSAAAAPRPGARDASASAT